MRCDYGIHHGKLCYSGLQLKYTKKNLVTAHIIRDKLCVCAEELETKMPFSFSFFFCFLDYHHFMGQEGSVDDDDDKIDDENI